MQCRAGTLAWVIALFLGACAASPPVRYYALSTQSGDFGTKPVDLVVGVGPISFPEYLDRPQIVTRSGNSELILADFDRWAEPVDRAFVRVLTIKLDRVLKSAVVTAFPYSNLVSPAYRVIGRVSQFDVDASGAAVLLVQWGVSDVDGRVLIPARSNRYAVPVTNAGDYASIVAALNETVDQLGAEMAAIIAAALAE